MQHPSPTSRRSAVVLRDLRDFRFYFPPSPVCDENLFFSSVVALLRPYRHPAFALLSFCSDLEFDFAELALCLFDRRIVPHRVPAANLVNQLRSFALTSSLLDFITSPPVRSAYL